MTVEPKKLWSDRAATKQQQIIKIKLNYAGILFSIFLRDLKTPVRHSVQRTSLSSTRKPVRILVRDTCTLLFMQESLPIHFKLHKSGRNLRLSLLGMDSPKRPRAKPIEGHTALRKAWRMLFKLPIYSGENHYIQLVYFFSSQRSKSTYPLIFYA